MAQRAWCRMVLVVCLGLLGLASVPARGAADAAGVERLVLVRQQASRTPTVEIARGEIDRRAFETMLAARRVIVERFPLPGRDPVALDLVAFDILTSGARLVYVDRTGEHEAPRPTWRAFRGTVAGDAASAVVLALDGATLSGSIRTGDGEFALGSRDGPAGVAVWSRSNDPDALDTPFCAAHLPEAPFRAADSPTAQGAGAPPIDGSTRLTAQVAIDATFEWYSRFGSLAAAQSYILTLMAQVSTLYENEVNVKIEVPYVRVFTTAADPYTDGTTNTQTLLGELRSEWNAHQTAIDRTVVHLFSVRPSGGAGVAYLNVLCSHDRFPGNSSDYGVSTLSATGASWEKSLVAHELGHNFSSPHTHCYTPEIDQCANETGCYSGPLVQTSGTIMSYCNQTQPVFSSRVIGERIRPAAEAAYPRCMTTDDTPAVPAAPQGLAAF